MYGLYSFVDTGAKAPTLATRFLLCFWDPFSVRLQPSPATALERKKNATAFVAAQVPKEDKALRDKLVNCLWSITPTLPADWVDFLMFVALAHHKLPPAKREAREARIQQLVDEQGLFSSGTPDEFARQKALLKDVAILYPDALMEATIESICGPMRFGACLSTPCPEELLSLRLKVLTMMANLDGKFPRSPDVTAALKGILIHCAPHALEARSEIVIKAACTDWSRLMLPALDRLNQWPPNGLHSGLSNLTSGVLFDTLAAGVSMPPDEPLLPVIEGIIDGAQARFAKIVSDVRQTTMEAVLGGVHLGPATEATVQAAERLIEEVTQLVNERMTSERLQHARDDGELQSDLTPVHAWSVNRLLRWIEGPIVNATPTRKVDRAGVVAAECPSKRPPVSTANASSPPPMTARDVDTLIENGYAATAAFFLTDITETVALATTLGADKALLGACDRLRPPLAQLASQPASVDELKAGPLLAQAESSIAALRGDIKAHQVQERLQQKFEAQLEAALAGETMVLGRRRGGVIACPMNAGDWPWVVGAFHQRLLPRTRRIEIDGETVLLSPDQALALYVTGSSQSSYAFDVSVHLWQRRHGSTSGPGLGATAWPAMNSPDWFDTYITCCVLHVPHAG